MGDGREIAYRVMSDTDGPVLDTQSPAFPMEMLVDHPTYERFLLALGKWGRLVVSASRELRHRIRSIPTAGTSISSKWHTSP